MARSPLPLRSALQGRPTRQRSAIHPDRRNPTGLSPSLAISDVPVRLGNADQVSRSTKSQLHGDESPADSTLDGTRFVRHYSGSPSWFLLLRIVICLSSPGTLLPSDATVRNLFSTTRRKFRRFDFGRQTTARISHILLGTELDRRSVLRRPSTGCDRRSFVVAIRRLPVECWAVRTAVVVSFAFSIFDVLWFACRGGSASSLQNLWANLWTGASVQDWPVTSTGRRRQSSINDAAPTTITSCRGRATAIYFVVRWWFSESARGQPTTLRRVAAVCFRIEGVR